MDSPIILTMQAAAVAICWLVVAGGAMLAVFSRTINDTVLERVSLSAVSITAFGSAWRIVAAGWVTNGGTSIAVALATYVVVVTFKHVRRYGA